MLIETDSRRLARVTRVCRMLPPSISGRVLMWMYPRKLAQQENAAFTARSSLADIYFRYPRCEVHATAFAIRGFFEWRNVVIANTLCASGDCIIDIGSNIGTETLLFAKAVGSRGTVVAFEPMPENFATLEDLKALNRLDQLKLRQQAVSDRPGELRFLPASDEWSTGVGRIADEGTHADNEIVVPSVTLDSLITAGEVPDPDLLVMDVEGVELFVLRGAAEMLGRAHPSIILEIQPRLLGNHDLTPAAMHEHLTGLGYRCLDISTWGLAPVNLDPERGTNWLCLHAERLNVDQTAARITGRLRRAAILPLVRGLNPAVVPTRD